MELVAAGHEKIGRLYVADSATTPQFAKLGPRPSVALFSIMSPGLYNIKSGLCTLKMSQSILISFFVCFTATFSSFGLGGRL